MHSRYELNNGVEIPVLGLGTWTLSGVVAKTALQWAFEAGYRLIDTASFYGNESEIGTAIAQSNVPREDLFITTKVWDSEQGYKETFKAFEQSLKRLKLDYLDLYLIHWPRDKFLETWSALEELYQDGKVKAIGVCNFTIEHLKELLYHATFTPTINQIEFHPFLYQKKLLEFCKSHNIKVEAYSPLTKGKKLSDKVLQDLDNKYKKSIPQIMLRWGLQHGIIEIPRSKNKDHIIENSDIFDFYLEESDMERLDNLNEDYRAVDDPVFT